MSDELIGMSELVALLGMSKQGVHKRVKEPDFPEPAARLACGPIWRLSDIQTYARARNLRFVERSSIVELAEAATVEAANDDVVLLEADEAARRLGCHPDDLRELGSLCPGAVLVSGELRLVREDALDGVSRLLGARFAGFAA